MQQKDLCDSHELFHLLVESVKDYAIFTTDMEGKITSWNNGSERFFGYGEAEILGRQATVLYTPEDREQGVPEQEMITAAAEGRAEDERWHLRRDGSRFWVSGMVTPLRDDAGNLCGFVKVGRDLTETKLAEESRLETEERFRVIAETASDAIITVDEASTILFVNPAVEKIFGYSPQELKGASLTTLMPDYLRRVHNAGIKRYIETDRKHIPWTGVELPGLHKNGREIPVEISFGEFTKEGRRFFTGIIRDISERKRIEKGLAAEHAVTRILAEEKTLVESAPRILQAICESLGWDLGALWRVDDTAGMLRCVQLWFDPAVEVAEFTQMCRDKMFAPGEGLPGRVWQSAAPLWIADVLQDANFPRKHVAAKEGLHGGVGFPIIAGNKVLGVMEFFSREIREPDEALLDMMMSVGSQTGQFIERRQTEETLRRREIELADYIENATIGLHWVGGDGIIKWANKAELALLGYTREEYFGHHIEEFHADQEVIDNILQRLTGDEALHDYESRMRCKDGTFRHVLISSNVFREGGEFIHTRCFTRDVTERKQAQAALQKAHEELELRVEQRTHEIVTANALLKEEILERAHAEKSLHESQGLLRGVIEGTSDIIFVKDLEGRYVLMNAAGVRWMGMDAEEITGKTDIELFGAETGQQSIEHDRQAIASGKAEAHEETILKGNELRTVQSIKNLYRDDEGKAIGVIGVSRDITERKRAEQAVESHREELSLILNNIDEIVYRGRLDDDSLRPQLSLINPQTEKLLGYQPEEFLNNPGLWVSIIHTDDLPSVIEQTKLLIGNGTPVTIEYRMKHKFTGEYCWIEDRIIPEFKHDGRVNGFFGAARDITQRKRMEAERDTERQMLNALFEQLPVGVLVRDTDGKYSRTNQRLCDILGIGSDDLIGLTTDEAAGLIKATKLDGTLLTERELASSIAVQTRSPTAPIEAVVTISTGEVRHITTTAAPIIVGNGEPGGSVAVIVDVSEQHALQEQLRQSQKLESIGILAGGIAHDFNNLLTAILGNTQLALRKLSPEDSVYNRLIEVEKAGNRAASLTRQLLAFSRRQRLERKTLNLNDTINDIMKMLKRIIGEDVEVRVQEAGSLSPVFADAAQVEQVVMNLAINAKDAMPGGGTLTIETRNAKLDEKYRREHSYAKPGKYVEMIVSDNGTGMDAETRNRIFEPFFTTKETGKGTGLGLSMVFGIVKQHGGMIEVESEPGRGTSFRIYLPVDENAVKEETQDVLPPIRGGTETILVAEDEEALRGLAQSILEDSGYTVLLAKDGAEAVEIYEANRGKISLLLLDIVMPRMGGSEAYERINQLDGAVPVLFMTGYSAEIVQYEFVKQNKFIEEAGAVLMQKPYSVETLGRKVREVLDAARRRR